MVANTGTPFSAEGVDSLQTANLSPKKRARRSLIGEKGLGFRAVLNCTDCPFISSGALRLVFSRRYASFVQDSLQASSAELAERIAKERHGTEELILPRLAFPAFDSNGDLNSWFDTPEQSTIAARCEALRKKGFDTAIGMPFRKPQDFEIAKKQLEELRPEILLFVESLHEISIQVESEEVGRALSRVKTGTAFDPIMGRNIAREMGLVAGTVELEFRAHHLLSLTFGGILGADESSVQGGVVARAEVGVDLPTRALLSVQHITGFGTLVSAWMRFVPARVVPMGVGIEATNQPGGQDYGVRLLYDLGLRLSQLFTVTLRGGYGARRLDASHRVDRLAPSVGGLGRVLPEAGLVAQATLA